MKIIICSILLILLIPLMACNEQPSVIASTDNSDLGVQILALQKRVEILEEKVIDSRLLQTQTPKSLEGRLVALEKKVEGSSIFPSYSDPNSLESRVKALEDGMQKIGISSLPYQRQWGQ